MTQPCNTIQPYDFQLEAVASIEERWRSHQWTMLVMATGLGKTVTFSELIRRRQHLGRALVIAHREELIYQAAEKIYHVTGIKPEIEKGSEWSREHSHMHRTLPVVASIQTLTSARGHGYRMNRFAPSDFATIIIDEAHRSASKTYMLVAQYFGRNANMRGVGVTATPIRTDGKALGRLFDSVAFVRDARWGIDNGYLVPIRHHPVIVRNLRLSDIASKGGDFTDKELDEKFSHEKIMHKVERGFIPMVGDDKTVVFVPGVKSAELLVNIINRRKPGAARIVTGKTPRDERRQLYNDFDSGVFHVIVNVGVLSEGWDNPSLKYVVLARPTKSKGLFMQMVGRGTRTLDGVIHGIESVDGRREAIARSDKPFCTIINVTGDPGQHKLVTPIDMLGGTMSDRVRKIAEETLETSDEPIDVDKAIADAEEMVQEHDRIESERKRNIIAEADVDWCDLDMFDVADLVAMREKGVYCDPQHVAYLEKLDIDIGGMDGRAISDKYAAVKKWIDGGGATPKQVRFLRKYGYDCSRMTSTQAKDLFLQIKRNGWRRPRNE